MFVAVLCHSAFVDCDGELDVGVGCCLVELDDYLEADVHLEALEVVFGQGFVWVAKNGTNVGLAWFGKV